MLNFKSYLLNKRHERFDWIACVSREAHVGLTESSCFWCVWLCVRRPIPAIESRECIVSFFGVLCEWSNGRRYRVHAAFDGWLATNCIYVFCIPFRVSKIKTNIIVMVNWIILCHSPFFASANKMDGSNNNIPIGNGACILYSYTYSSFASGHGAETVANSIYEVYGRLRLMFSTLCTHLNILFIAHASFDAFLWTWFNQKRKKTTYLKYWFGSAFARCRNCCMKQTGCGDPRDGYNFNMVIREMVWIDRHRWIMLARVLCQYSPLFGPGRMYRTYPVWKP